VIVAALALAAPAGASARIESCPPDPADKNPIRPTKVITGEFDTSMQGSYVMLPFRVREGATAVRVRYCYDQPDVKPPGLPGGNTLDLGLYDALRHGDRMWGVREFRGWGGSSHPDVTVSPNGFSSVAAYLAHPKTHVRGKTTRGFEPGQVPAGRWAVELGVASVTPQDQGDADGEVAWRVEIQVIRSRRYANRPYRPAHYDSRPARSAAGWYAGDLHVHSEHSNLGAATMRQTFNYAFKPISDGGAGLDFITLSDYVTHTAWGEIGRHQSRYPRHLIVRSAEVVTYRGHATNHGTHRFVDYRTGPILQRLGGGRYRLLRGPTPASRIFDTVHRAGGWTQINHPTIFPSQVPGFSSFCRGCSWDFSDRSTDYRKVDAIEIATGPAGVKPPPRPGPNPFTLLALDFYEHALGTGAHIAAVGSSDSHHAGSTDSDPISGVTQSPIGEATTVVFAPRLSERGIERGVKARHTYVKIFGNDGPDLRFTARAPGSGAAAMMGDTLGTANAQFTARVLGAGPSAARPGPYLLIVLKDGAVLTTGLVSGDDYTMRFGGTGAGHYMLELVRLSGVAAIEAVSSPIWLEP
jgi:hypothetical protein